MLVRKFTIFILTKFGLKSIVITPKIAKVNAINTQNLGIFIGSIDEKGVTVRVTATTAIETKLPTLSWVASLNTGRSLLLLSDGSI